MPTECVANPLQRALADAIILMQPLDEIRILLACGSKVTIVVCFDILGTKVKSFLDSWNLYWFAKKNVIESC